MNYFAAELHCHTLHSDGTFTLEELCRSAKDEGLAVIASTDHNTQSAQLELTDALQSETLPVISGIEWTTFFGHMLVLGAVSFVDWRFALPDNIDTYIKQVKDAGGLVGLAHPFDLGSPMCTGGHWDFQIKDWNQVDYIEVWHEDAPALKTPNLRALALWTRLLDAGYHIGLTYGKDWHGPWDKEMISACTYLGIKEEKITSELALEAIRQGRTAVTLGPAFVIRLSDGKSVYHIGDTVPPGSFRLFFFTDEEARRAHWERFQIRAELIRLVGNGGRVLQEMPYQQGTVQIPVELEHGWIRGELWGTVNGQNCALAMTGAIYID